MSAYTLFLLIIEKEYFINIKTNYLIKPKMRLHTKYQNPRQSPLEINKKERRQVFSAKGIPEQTLSSS